MSNPPRDPEWRERFIQMRKNCRAANKGAEANSLIAQNALSQIADYRKKAYEHVTELARLEKENKSLRNVLRQEMTHADKEISKLKSQLWKKK